MLISGYCLPGIVVLFGAFVKSFLESAFRFSGKESVFGGLRIEYIRLEMVSVLKNSAVEQIFHKRKSNYSAPAPPRGL